MYYLLFLFPSHTVRNIEWQCGRWGHLRFQGGGKVYKDWYNSIRNVLI